MKEKLIIEFLKRRLPLTGKMDTGLLKTQLAIFYEFLEEQGAIIQTKNLCRKKKCKNPVYEFELCFKHFCQGETI